MTRLISKRWGTSLASSSLLVLLMASMLPAGTGFSHRGISSSSTWNRGYSGTNGIFRLSDPTGIATTLQGSVSATVPASTVTTVTEFVPPVIPEVRGTACLIDAPEAVGPPLRKHGVGHVGWAFRQGNGNWIFGATEGTGDRTIKAGKNTNFGINPGHGVTSFKYSKIRESLI